MVANTPSSWTYFPAFPGSLAGNWMGSKASDTHRSAGITGGSLTPYAGVPNTHEPCLSASKDAECMLQKVHGKERHGFGAKLVQIRA